MEAKTWKCDVCGYIHKGEELPATCPICGVGPDQFSEVAIEPFQPKEPVGSWRCNVCGYIHEGDTPPETCPVCNVPAEHFTAQSPTAADASEHDAMKVVIIGAGIAGVTAAETACLVKGVEVTLITKEAGLPYYRLNLTRYLAGNVDKSSLTMKDKEWFDQNNVQLLEGDVVSIDKDAHTVSLRRGETIGYDKLIIAAGAHAFVPPILGINKADVGPLRTITDTDNFIACAGKGEKCIVIGGGLLGLEAAGALSMRGCDVTVLEGYGWVLPRQLPEPAGKLLVKYLEAKGIKVLTGARTKEIVGDENARAVLLDDGSELPADMVVVSTGVRPNSYLARQCGLNVAGGIVVNDKMQTSDPDILAAGDVVEHRGVVYGIWPTAYLQGAVAASNAIGKETAFRGLPPSNRLKVLDVDLFSIGDIKAQDASYREYEHQEGEYYHRLVTKDGVLKGAVLFGDTTWAGKLQEAIEAKTQLTEWPDLKTQFPCLNE